MKVDYFADLCYSIFLKINTPSITPIFSYIFDPVMLILFTLYFIGIFKEKKSNEEFAVKT